jgi:hypothetical protein
MPNPNEWEPDHPAIWRENAPGTGRAITLRHPSYPYEVTWNSGVPGDLFALAVGYLRKVNQVFGLPLLFDIAGDFDVRLTWLPLDLDDRPEPFSSIWVKRFAQPGAPAGPIDRTAILLAVQSLQPNNVATALGSRLGIRVVAHVSPEAQPPWRVRITGSACSAGLAPALGPYHPDVVQFLQRFFENNFVRLELSERIRQAANLSADPISVDGWRLVVNPQPVLELYATVPRPVDDPNGLAYALTGRVRVLPPPLESPLEIVDRSPLVAAAPPRPVRPRLFPQDPASQPGRFVDARPNRSPARLEPYRRPVTLPGLIFDPQGVHLVDNFGQVMVTQSKLVQAGADETQEQVVDVAAVPHARTNAFAALSGYQHARELFDTMRAYGFSPAQYFKFAALPLLVRYRATIKPGPGKDGRTVNAQVAYDPPGGNPWANTGQPKPLQVRFALADLLRSDSRREPLGMTADPRWSWHEYGHVLLAAATGALEFLFAHSAGDALAAIRCDPASALWDRPRRRGETYPWARLSRRHDRPVRTGWSWSGTYHRAADFSPVVENRRRKGYKSEQILSTSLFRLYLALGGDTRLANNAPDVPARQAAADYVVYLIMRAIRSLGPAFAVMGQTPGQLVSALIDADVGTLPVATGPLAHRVGGWAHKVVHWAFEAQGLDPNANPLAVVNAPGPPPDVDIYIDDGRPDSEGPHPRGGYMPVSLDWNGATPSWHASATAITVAGNQVLVEVRNRGRVDAAGVVVQVRSVNWPLVQPDPPKWDPAKWGVVGASLPQMVPAGPNPVVFGPFALAPHAGRRLILAEATCEADRANTDPNSALPCATTATPIVDLVAGDNNLGLRRLP